MEKPLDFSLEISRFICECELLSLDKPDGIFLCLSKEYSFIEEREKNSFHISEPAWDILRDNFFFSSSSEDDLIHSGEMYRFLRYRNLLLEDVRGIVSYIHTPELLSV